MWVIDPNQLAPSGQVDALGDSWQRIRSMVVGRGAVADIDQVLKSLKQQLPRDGEQTGSAAGAGGGGAGQGPSAFGSYVPPLFEVDAFVQRVERLVAEADRLCLQI